MAKVISEQLYEKTPDQLTEAQKTNGIGIKPVSEWISRWLD